MKTRKNKKLLVVVAMVLMIGLVAGMGAMTYSRYITTGTTSQNATAAKWGFVVNVQADSLFGTKYTGTTLSTVNEGAETGITIKSNSEPATDVVAPGSTGSMTFSIEGTAEVKAQITITGDVDNEIHYDDYYPVKWTLKKGAEIVDGCNGVKLSEIMSAINAGPVAIEAGEAADAEGTYTLSWAWALETADVSGLNGANRNVEDSLIGYKSAGKPWDDVLDPAQKGINGTYVGNYKIGTTPAEETNYASNIETAMIFTLSINIEQIQ